MGWKYRKRVRVLPGFYLNFSTSGMSATVGMKGFNVNIGQKGTYLNTGIPGTGIYDRFRLDTNPADKPEHDTSSNGAVDIKSFKPELMTSDGLFGLKESIIKAQEIKAELYEDIAKTENKKKSARSLSIFAHIFIFGIFIRWFRDNYNARKSDAEEAENAYKNFKLDIDFNMDDSVLNDYVLFQNSFEKLAASQKIWDITSSKGIDSVKERSAAGTTVTRSPVSFSMGTLDYINAKYEAFKLHNANGGDLYIYPGFIVMPSKQSNDFALIDFRDIQLEHHRQKFLESGTVPSDTKIIDRTWEYVNKNGLPDKRYSNNREIPIVVYYEIVLKSSKGLYESYQFSNVELAENFCRAFETYQNSLVKMKWDKEEGNG